MMKIFFLFVLLFLTSASSVVAQSTTIDEIIRSIPVTSPATADSRKQLVKSIYVFPEYRKFPDYICRDFQRTIHVKYPDPDKKEFCSAYFQFRKPGNNNFTVLGVSIGESDTGNTLLVTYDMSGNQIDWIEVEVFFGDIKLKQYQITPDMKLHVYELKPSSATPIFFLEDYVRGKITSMAAQRIDAVYQIDDNGKVQKLSEKKYKPKDYPISVLENITISNGTETSE